MSLSGRLSHYCIVRVHFVDLQTEYDALLEAMNSLDADLEALEERSNLLLSDVISLDMSRATCNHVPSN